MEAIGIIELFAWRASIAGFVGFRVRGLRFRVEGLGS